MRPLNPFLMLAATCLFCCSTIASPFAMAEQPTNHRLDLHLIGSMDSRLGLDMTLHTNGNDVSGTYSYTRIGKPLKLKGKIENSNQIILDEFDAHGKNTGKFHGDLIKDKRFEGSWSPAGTSAHNHGLPFLLASASDPNALDEGVDGMIMTQGNKRGPRNTSGGGGDFWSIRYPELVQATIADKTLSKNIQNSLISALKFPDVKPAEPDQENSDTLEEINYQITYNKNHLISVIYDGSALDAHLNTFKYVTVVDTKSGKVVKAKDAFEASSFVQLKALIKKNIQEIANDQIKYCERHREDYSDYEIQQLKGNVAATLKDSPIDLDSFVVMDGGIDFIYNWVWPHGIATVEPGGDNVFSFNHLQKFIRKNGPLAEAAFGLNTMDKKKP